MKPVTRRDFIKGTAAGLGGFLALETLQSCAPSEPGGTDTTTFKAPPDIHAGLPVEFEEESKYTNCWIGKQECGMVARIVKQNINGAEIKRIIKFEGNPDNPRNNGALCPKGMAQIQAIYDYNRVKTPLKRTNRKGDVGRFVQIGWDEALNTIAGKLQSAKNDATPVLWQKGRSKAEPLYDGAFLNAMKDYGLKASKLGHGAFCSDAGYRAAEYTIGFHGVLHPDFRYTKYLLSWGWNLTRAGGNKFCWITWPQEFVKARDNGMKVVALDPDRRSTGPHADEWIPNKPGTDLAFFLGLQYYLATNNFIDQTYLKSYTNAPFLVKSDGTVAKDADGKELVWDETSGQAVAYDTAGISPALTGSYTVSNETVKTAYERLLDHLKNNAYTPDWADQVCGLPPLTTARIARELYENSGVATGATITLDGITMPFRPVSIMAYHVAQQELGFLSVRAAIMAYMLLGAIDVPGGLFIDIAPGKQHAKYTDLNKISVKTKDLDYQLGGSKFFPISSGNPAFIARVLLEPTRYNVKESTIPKIMISHMHNGAVAFPDTVQTRRAWSKFEFVVDINPWLSDTASLFADIILPAATIEKYEGPGSAKALYKKADSLRLPPIDPLWESKGDIDIYLDIAERTGFLSQYLTHVNKELKISLDTGSKPSTRTIFDAWAKTKKDEGIAYFEQHGVTGAKDIAAKDFYAYAWGYGGKHRLYGESLLSYQTAQIAAGVSSIYYRDYTAFPTWRQPTMESSPGGYDLYLISFKSIENKQSRSSFIPLLAEIAPKQGVLLNPKTAQARGIGEGDTVYVESHNAVTGETRAVKTLARLHQSIRPDTVAMSHHYGMTTHPNAKGQGPTPNELFFSTEGYVQCTQDASFQVKVRVYRA